MKVGVLTSSRADFGILVPLLKKIASDDFFDLEVIAFGTHTSTKHGYTITEIEHYDFQVLHALSTVPSDDSPQAISQSIGNTITIFSKFWSENIFDLLVCLGDRYEMFAAVSASTPFNIPIAHIHGGETTLGAIDNAYRHAISLFSHYIFTATEKYKKRAEAIVEPTAKVFNVGALSIDNLQSIDYYTVQDFLKIYGIDLSKPTILSTFHPETVSLDKNKEYIEALLKSFLLLKDRYQIIITLPNADTKGDLIRDHIFQFKKKFPMIHVVESLGMLGYLSCMKHSSFLLGNTSSGFIEASFFPKYVINLGDRQKGRMLTSNILSIAVDEEEILKAVDYIEQAPEMSQLLVYGQGNTADEIIKIFKQIEL